MPSNHPKIININHDKNILNTYLHIVNVRQLRTQYQGKINYIQNGQACNTNINSDDDNYSSTYEQTGNQGNAMDLDKDLKSLKFKQIHGQNNMIDDSKMNQNSSKLNTKSNQYNASSHYDLNNIADSSMMTVVDYDMRLKDDN